jgi:hypothetical protein
MPSGLEAGAAISRGAKAFLSSYYQAHQMELQQKQQANAVIVNALTRQLEDENLPYYERAKILDSIPQLVGAKLKAPLSVTMGLDKFNEKDVITKEATKGTPNSLQTDTNAIGQTSSTGDPNATDGSLSTSSPLADSFNTKGTQGTAAETDKMGNLSPAFMKKKLIMETNAANDANDIDKQTKILKINYELQARVLNKGGYNQKIAEAFDPSGNYLITMSNGTDTKTINLGKVNPLALEKSKIAANKPTGKLGQLQTAQQVIQEYQTDPTSHSYADYTAAQQFIDHFEKTGQLLEAQITSTNQGNTGTKPIQPPQKADDARADQDRQRAAQTAIDEADAKEKAALATREQIAKQKNAAWQEAADAKQKLVAAQNDGLGPQDPAYRDAENEYNRKDAIARGLEEDYRRAHQAYTEAVTLHTAAAQRAGNFKPSSTPLSEIEAYKTKIEKFRNNPKNAGKVKNLSDQQIVDMFKTQGIKP